MNRRLLPHRATIVNREPGGARDDLGNVIDVDVTYEDVPCYVTWGSTTENVDGQDLVVHQARSAWLPTAPLTSASAVNVNLGRGIIRFEVDGEVAIGTNARTGDIDHLEANLRRSTG